MAYSKTFETQTTWLKDIPSSIALIDKNLNLIDASQNWFQKFQLAEREDEIRGSNIFEIFPRFSEDWKVKLDYALDGLANIQVMDRVIGDKDKEVKYLWHLSPWKDGYGNQIGVILNVEDVGENHNLQMELQRTKGNLYDKGKMAKIGSWEYGLEENQVTWSQNIREILGIDAMLEGTMENMISFFNAGRSRDTFRTVLEMAVRTGKPWEEKLEITMVDNKSLWVKSIGRPKFKGGKCSRIIGTLQAISDVHESASPDTAQGNGLNYKSFFEHAPEGMVVIDFKSGKFLRINKALSSLLGRTEDELRNKSFKNFLNPKELGQSNPIRQLSKQGDFGPLEIKYVKGRTKRLSLQLKGQLITAQNGNKQVLATVIDITKHKEKQLILEEQIGKTADEIVKLVNFAHMTSHNLKGQASNLSLLLQFLKTEKMDKERDTLLTMLFKAADSLTDTIKGLREIVTIRQNVNSRKRPLVLNEYLFKAEQGLSGLIKKENAKIVNEIPDDFKVRALPIYLESILSNVLSNAIKFKKKGKRPMVVISAKTQKYYTEVSIEDNGIGMDVEMYKDKLFGLYEAFQRDNESRGMGLYLVKYQMELMKGRVEWESKPDEGSVFKLLFFNK